MQQFPFSGLRACSGRFALLGLLAAAALSVAEVPATLAQGAKKEARAELILSNLPPKGSKAYKDLLGLAGKEAKGQVLTFTKPKCGRCRRRGSMT